MSEEKKQGHNVGGLGSNDAPPSPFTNKKTSGELLEKLRTHTSSDHTAKPDIPTRQGRTAELSEDQNKTERRASVISRMRENSKVVNGAEKIFSEEGEKAKGLVKVPGDEENDAEDALSTTRDTEEKPKDDDYDIRTVFGISENEKNESEIYDGEESDDIGAESFIATKEFARLKSDFFVCVFKMSLCLILGIATFFFENYEILGIRNSVFIRISSDVRVSSLAAMQFTIFAIIIMFREMVYGAKKLVSLNCQPESFLPVIAAFMIIYEFVALFSGYDDFIPFNFLVFSVSFFYLVSKWWDLKSRLHALKVISSKSIKYSLVKMKKTESAPEREATSSIIDLSEDANYIRVVRSKEIRGYSARSKSRIIYKRLSGAFTVASIVAAVVAFLIAKRTCTFAESFMTAFVVIAFTTPFSMYTVFSFPIYKVSKKAVKTGTAVIGDGVSMEYSAPAFVTFSDNDIFTDKNVWLDEVAMKDSESFSKGLAYASAVFKPISGPLNRLFAEAADYEVTNETVEYIDISDDGLEAVVNRERVRIGQASYFTRYGYLLDDESYGNYRIMYVEIGNVIALKVKLVYNIDKDFEKILQNLYKSGMGVVIRTSDPNINLAMIESIIGTGRFPIKVLKYRTEKEMDDVRDSVDAGIVSKNKVRPLLETLYRCDRAGAVMKSGLLLEAVAFVLGIVAVVVLTRFGSLVSLGSVFVALYHMFWSALVFLLTMIFV